MTDRLAGKVAIVTGAGSNIGRGVALRFAAEGARVAVADIARESGEETAALIAAAGGQAHAYALDVSDEAAVLETIGDVAARWGGLHILHNNAVYRTFAAPGAHPLLDFDAGNWRREFDVNVLGAAFGCKHAIPHIVKAGGGAILNSSSVNGLVGDLHRPQYGMCKAAINNLTMTVAALHGRQGIRCNAIAPGNIPRGGIDAHPWAKLDSPYAVADRHQIAPRRGVPEDIAALALFLASTRAASSPAASSPATAG
ncbi:MAG: SDR family oxidoreductase [Sphingomonadaceae bacterium]|nr:SDR family oxidoreductase [Sphingomonadaceae bacterium]